MTVRRTDTAEDASPLSSLRPPALTAPDLGRLRDGEADELAADEMVEDLRLAEADLSGVEDRDHAQNATARSERA